MTETTLVVGATGTLGGHVLSRLVALGQPVRAAVRDPMRWTASPAVHFDFDRPDTFGPALDGAARVFLIARPGDDHADVASVPLLDEAKRRGVRRVVDVSAMGVDRADHAPALRAIEKRLEASGMAWTHLRPGFFDQLFTQGPLHAAIRASGTIAVPAADAKLSFIDARDIADVAVAAIVRGELDGAALTLTGDRAIDHSEVAHTITTASGREVRYVSLSEEDTRAALERARMPDARIERLLRFYRLVRAGAASEVTSSVRDVLGRSATSFEAFARDHAAAWRA